MVAKVPTVIAPEMTKEKKKFISINQTHTSSGSSSTSAQYRITTMHQIVGFKTPHSNSYIYYTEVPTNKLGLIPVMFTTSKLDIFKWENT